MMVSLLDKDGIQSAELLIALQPEAFPGARHALCLDFSLIVGRG